MLTSLTPRFVVGPARCSDSNRSDSDRSGFNRFGSAHDTIFSWSRTVSIVALTCLAVGCGDGDTPVDGTGGAVSTGSGGTPGSGGGSRAASGGGAGAGAVPSEGDFQLLFEEEFDTLDTSRWQAASHTFAENQAQFAPSQVEVADGKLVLTLDHDGEGGYVSGELRTIEFFSYGRFETRARFAPGSGVVSSLFTYYDHWAFSDKPENWNELDVEFLGGDPESIQFNVIHWNESNQRTTHEQHHPVTYDPSAEFHDYAIEWLPSVVNFYVDGELVHSQTDQIAEFVTLEQRVMMNVWPVADQPGLNAWAGQFDDSVLPVSAEYEWVRVSEYTGG